MSEQGFNHCHPINNIGKGMAEQEQERHVCIMPKKGHVCYRTSWGTSGSDPNLEDATWQTVQKIKERYEKMGATTEIIADGTQLLKMAQELSGHIGNPYGNAVSGGRLSIDEAGNKAEDYIRRGYEIHAIVSSPSAPHDSRLVIGETRLTRERQYVKAKQKVEALKAILEGDQP